MEGIISRHAFLFEVDSQSCPADVNQQYVSNLMYSTYLNKDYARVRTWCGQSGA